MASFSPRAIREHLDFAFDGTVTAIGPSVSERPDRAHLSGLVGVTFKVHRWFKGGSGNVVVVDMRASGTGGSWEDPPTIGTYAVGTRLLVSGAARWGGPDPLSAPIAWTGCGGFTRYHSPEVAHEWEGLFLPPLLCPEPAEPRGAGTTGRRQT